MEWLERSQATVMLRFNGEGQLLQANAGFWRLLQNPQAAAGGSSGTPSMPDLHLDPDLRQILVQPPLAQLTSLRPDDQGLLYQGRLSLGWPDQSLHSVMGQVFALPEQQLLLMAECDIADLERLQSKVLGLNEDLAQSQRALVRANRKLEQQVQQLDEALRASLVQEQELRIASIAFETQEAIFITDAELKLLRVNRAFCQHTGIQAEQAVGAHWSWMLSARHEASFSEALLGELRRQGSWQGEFWCRTRTGEDCPEWLTLTAVKDSWGQPLNYVGSFLDISERKAAEVEIFNLAFYDPLTQLPNRRLLHDRLQHAMSLHKRNHSCCGLVFLDLDNFKMLNDTLGHSFGDALLVEAAGRLKKCVRDTDTVARLGGDEFVLLLEGLTLGQAEDQVKRVVSQVAAQINQPFRLSIADARGQRLRTSHECSASIGVALQQRADDSAEELLRHADLAMYQAKAAGRNQVRFFEPQMQTALSTRAALEIDLREAIRLEQFELYFQPQVDAQGCTLGAEALIRWRHPVRGWVSPAEFIPLAEDSGLILPIGLWVLQQACQVLARWATLPARQGLSLAVNVSARQFRQADFIPSLISCLQASGASAQALKLELTESTLLADAAESTAKMMELREAGLQLALDDFGTGFSSLAYLKRLPLQQIKIDQGFVKDLPHDANDASITRAIIDLARNLGLEVIAEGVETAAQRSFLQTYGCQRFQGYLFGPPMPLAALEALLDAHDLRAGRHAHTTRDSSSP
jgi:diguanylate cyclase (GGDEF)-like protein/PAS domain S-box-containing protein